MRTIIALAMGLTASVANAQQSDPVKTMGIGTSRCERFLQLYDATSTAADDVYFTWATGFMSGLNTAITTQKTSSHDLSAKSEDEQKSLLRSYCTNHPLGTYMQAVLNVYFDLTIINR